MHQIDGPRQAFHLRDLMQLDRDVTATVYRDGRKTSAVSYLVDAGIVICRHASCRQAIGGGTPRTAADPSAPARPAAGVDTSGPVVVAPSKTSTPRRIATEATTEGVIPPWPAPEPQDERARTVVRRGGYQR
ncbi:hypothetical protein MSHI_40610 [Mycobacterium shinjukuense]|uniref:Uncharacterized protein n=1 Tax=Mycobacterium shinjukuense TaxID=398694 RepID=A0A7I7MVI8_9MYCO|nr:hypothetical protein MSHI_40610 [Mycobacterium shinjukuense]